MTSFNRLLSISGVCLLAGLFFTAPLTTLRIGSSATVGDIFLVLVIVLAASVLVFRRRLPVIPTWMWIGGVMLAFSIMITVIWPPASVADLVDTYFPTPYGSSTGAGLRLLIALLVLPVIVSMIVDRWSTVSLLVNFWIAGATVSCLVAVLDGFVGTDLQISLADNGKEVATYLGQAPARFVGLGVHPTSFSVTAAMASAMVFARMNTAERFLKWSPVVLILSLGIVLSASRVGYVGILVAAVLTLWLNPAFRSVLLKPNLRVHLPAAAILVISAAVMVAGSPTNPIDNPEVPDDSASVNRLSPVGGASDKSNSERIAMMENSIDFIVDRPLGGYGYEWIESAHNLYLQLLVSGGIVALIGFLVIMFGYLRDGRRARKLVPTDLSGIPEGLIISLVTFLIMGMVQTDLLDRYLYLPAALILAITVLATRRNSDDSAGESAPQ